MPYPLTLVTMLQRNRMLFGKKEVVGRDFSGIHRYTYSDYNIRVAKLANALKRLGVRPGETTEDGNVSLLTARCLGACSLAPAVIVDGVAVKVEIVGAGVTVPVTIGGFALR